jgi:hypothetical protein
LSTRIIFKDYWRFHQETNGSLAEAQRVGFDDSAWKRVENACRYKLVTEVLADGQPTDVHETRFGLRYFSFDPSEGFSLNGRYMKLHGVYMRHDLGALGAAVNDRLSHRSVSILRRYFTKWTSLASTIPRITTPVIMSGTPAGSCTALRPPWQRDIEAYTRILMSITGV